MEDTDLYGKSLPPPPSPRSQRTRAEIAAAKKAKADEKADRRTVAWVDRHAPEAHPAEISFRHSGWRPKRHKVFEALKAVHTDEANLWNFQQCGACATVEWSEELQRRRIRASYCRCRHCEPCARAKANKIAANLRAKLDPRNRGCYRMVTLTLLHTDTPLRDQIDRLYRCFKKLRATPPWKKSQKGGVVVLEVKHNGTHWHPHLHIFTEGAFIKKETLSELWHQVTGDSYIVKVNLIDRGTDAAAYVCKYITKSTDASTWSTPDRAQEWILASKGLRTANTFGTWRKFPLLDVADGAKDWKPENGLVRLMWLARQGDQVCYDILESLLSMRCNEECQVHPLQFPVADQESEWNLPEPAS